MEFDKILHTLNKAQALFVLFLRILIAKTWKGLKELMCFIVLQTLNFVSSHPNLSIRIFTGVCIFVVTILAFTLRGIFLNLYMAFCVVNIVKEADNILEKTTSEFKKFKPILLVYLSLIPFMILEISGTSEGLKNLIFVLVCVFSTDIGAFFIGKNFGKRKIMPEISPAKTFEGLVGGIFFAMTISQIYLIFTKSGKSFLIEIFLSLVISILSQVGDFTESYFKRLAKIKDSGSLLPGHGGILDRIDGLIFTVPLLYLIKRFI